jgi:hypothetical protein
MTQLDERKISINGTENHADEVIHVVGVKWTPVNMSLFHWPLIWEV